MTNELKRLCINMKELKKLKNWRIDFMKRSIIILVALIVLCAMPVLASTPE